MAKQWKLKGNRKMPEPSPDHEAVVACIERAMPNLQPLLREVDAVIRAIHPEVQFGVKWRRPFYYLPEHGWIIELAPYDITANVVFLGGAEFDDPPPLGSGESRYIKVSDVAEVTTPQMREWITHAGIAPGVQ